MCEGEIKERTEMDFASTTAAGENRIRWKVVGIIASGIPTPLPGYETK